MNLDKLNVCLPIHQNVNTHILILNEKYICRQLHIFYICKNSFACNHSKYYLCPLCSLKISMLVLILQFCFLLKSSSWPKHKNKSSIARFMLQEQLCPQENSQPAFGPASYKILTCFISSFIQVCLCPLWLLKVTTLFPQMLTPQTRSIRSRSRSSRKLARPPVIMGKM